jgi:hypothetical protein
MKDIKNNLICICFVWLVLVLILSCSEPNKNKKSIPFKNTATEITLKQESAFEALNTLQVSTDNRNQLYSTFAGINQSCYPPDTSLTISQEELLEAMEQFVTIHCTGLSPVERNKLASASVRAQEEYTVHLCLKEIERTNSNKRIPRKGIWILPNVLERRDIIINW